MQLSRLLSLGSTRETRLLYRSPGYSRLCYKSPKAWSSVGRSKQPIPAPLVREGIVEIVNNYTFKFFVKLEVRDGVSCRSVSRLFHRTVGRLVGSSVGRLIRQQVSRSIGRFAILSDGRVFMLIRCLNS